VSRWTEGGRRKGKGAGGGGHIYIGVIWMRRRRRTAPLLGRTGVAKVWDRKRALALSANQIRIQNRREGEEGVAKGVRRNAQLCRMTDGGGRSEEGEEEGGESTRAKGLG